MEYDEYPVNSGYISNCCGAPILGEVIDGLGLCSNCKEWAEAELTETDD